MKLVLQKTVHNKKSVMTLTLSRRGITMTIYSSVLRFAQIYRVVTATMYFKWAIACSYGHLQENNCCIAATTKLALSPLILLLNH